MKRHESDKLFVLGEEIKGTVPHSRRHRQRTPEAPHNLTVASCATQSIPNNTKKHLGAATFHEMRCIVLLLGKPSPDQREQLRNSNSQAAPHKKEATKRVTHAELQRGQTKAASEPTRGANPWGGGNCRERRE